MREFEIPTRAPPVSAPFLAVVFLSLSAHAQADHSASSTRLVPHQDVNLESGVNIVFSAASLEQMANQECRNAAMSVPSGAVPVLQPVWAAMACTLEQLRQLAYAEDLSSAERAEAREALAGVADTLSLIPEEPPETGDTNAWPRALIDGIEVLLEARDRVRKRFGPSSHP